MHTFPRPCSRDQPNGRADSKAPENPLNPQMLNSAAEHWTVRYLLGGR